MFAWREIPIAASPIQREDSPLSFPCRAGIYLFRGKNASVIAQHRPIQRVLIETGPGFDTRDQLAIEGELRVRVSVLRVPSNPILRCYQHGLARRTRMPFALRVR